MQRPSGKFVTYEEAITNLQDRYSDPSWQPVRLGMGALDTAMAVYPGQVCGLVGRAGVGKSQLLATIERHFLAEHPGAGCAVLTLEMSAEKWAERRAAMHLGLTREQVEALGRDGRLVEEARNAGLFDATLNADIFVGSATLDSLPKVIEEHRSRLAPVPLQLVLIDYAQRIRGTGRDEYERNSAVAIGLKDLAVQADVAVVIAMQLSREAGDGSAPVSMSMIRGSGMWEEGLDYCVGLWRPGKSKDVDDVERLRLKYSLSCSLLKNRDGEDGIVDEMLFDVRTRELQLGTRGPI